MELNKVCFGYLASFAYGRHQAERVYPGMIEGLIYNVVSETTYDALIITQYTMPTRASFH